MKEPPEFIFLPHFKAEPAQKGYSSSQVCPFAQGEPFYLQTAFKEAIGKLKKKGMNILTPLLDLTKGLDAAEKPLIETAVQMGIAKKEAKAAFKKALIQQIQCVAEMKEIGKNALKSLETDPHKIGVVIFSRSYSGFVDEAHMGIPNKLASRGVLVMPLDFLQLNDEKRKPHMYWGAGQRMLGAGSIVKGHPQLFGTIITNFSCGPDSFIIGYFRDIMGRKPSLTLELDSHTADAGIDTRIEAFLDVVAAYRHLTTGKEIHRENTSFISARTVMDNGTAMVITSSGKALPMTDPHVTLLLPSMGKLASESVAAIFRGAGYNAKPHLPPDETILKMGRGNTSCKECLPLILTTGTLLSYIHDVRKKDEVLVYFMPTGSGPCRFGQYYVFMQDLVKRLEIPDVALLALSSENAYAGMGDGLNRKGWWAIIVSDVMEDIRSMILANAKAPRAATQLFDDEWN